MGVWPLERRVYSPHLGRMRGIGSVSAPLRKCRGGCEASLNALYAEDHGVGGSLGQ